MITSRTVETRSVTETEQFGRDLAADLTAGTVLAMTGELGSGKTCLIKGIAAGLGIKQTVTSPTFTIIHEYHGGRLPLNHIDLYRLAAPEQALAIGIMDYLDGEGVTVIEWAERIESLLPPGTIHVKLSALDETTRRITIS